MEIKISKALEESELMPTIESYIKKIKSDKAISSEIKELDLRLTREIWNATHDEVYLSVKNLEDETQGNVSVSCSLYQLYWETLHLLNKCTEQKRKRENLAKKPKKKVYLIWLFDEYTEEWVLADNIYSNKKSAQMDNVVLMALADGSTYDIEEREVKT